LAPLAEDELPDYVTSLDISMGDMARLVGYRFEISDWRPGEENALFLYWQILEALDSALVNAFQVVLSLSSSADSEPVLTVVYPVLPHSPVVDELQQGTVVPARYPLILPPTLNAGDYSLEACLTTLASETIRCLPLSITVDNP
jgi:hypothetical protein